MNYLMSRVICACFIHIILHAVEAHVRFVCPRPQSPRSDIFEQWPTKLLDGPCGLGNDVQFDSEYMELTPGPFTVIFEETAFHKDSPFRISLHEFGKKETDEQPSCLLLDQIPHNNGAVVTSHCKTNGYPIGHCDSSKYSLNIKIPDITCDRCYLKLAFILTDEKESCIGENSTCETYYSCANIKIRPSHAGEQLNISSCGNYLNNLLGPWPTRPQQIYKVDKLGDGNDYSVAGSYDPYLKQLQIDVQVKNGDRDSMKTVAVVGEAADGNRTYLFSHNITKSDFIGDSVVVVWSNMSAIDQQLLKGNNLTVAITFKDKEENGTLEYTKGYNTVKEYKPLNALYSHDGWLAGPDFIGPMATFPSAIEPAGSCTSTPHTYVAFLHLYGIVDDFHGVVTMSFVDQRVHLTAAIHGLNHPISSIHAVGPELGGAPSFFVTNSSKQGSIMYTVTNATEQMKFLGTVQFLKTVVVRTLDMLVDGELQQAMQVIIKDGLEVRGVGGFQFTKGQWLTYEILIMNPDSDLKEATFLVPENFKKDGPIIYDVTHHVTNLKGGHWLVKGTLKDLSSVFLLALWKGWITFSAKTVKGTVLSGTVSPPGIWYCSQVKGAPCPMVNMLPVDTVFVDEGEKVLPAMGLGAFLLDRVDVLQYSIIVENLPKKASGSLDANLMIMGTNHSIVLQLHPYPGLDKAYLLHGTLPEPAPEIIHALAAAIFKLIIKNPRVGKKPFNISLPSITRELCTEAKVYDVGGKEDGWKVGKEFPTLYALVYDNIKFVYSSNNSVYLMKSKDEYDECDFTHASLVGPPTENRTEIKYSLSIDGRLYFASKLNCNATPPLKIEVVAVSGVAPQTADLNDCGTSLYDIWRKQKLSTFNPPNPIAAALGGIFAGIILLVIFFVWDTRVNRKKSGNLALFERF